MTGRTDAPRLKVRPQILSGGEIAMGPGKAALLDAIVETGSISAAGRRLGMSYRRTWLLVDAMNRCWAEPLVAAVTGGVKGGGARVTPFGQAVRADYAAWEARLEAAAAGTGDMLARLRAEPLPPGGAAGGH